MGGSPDGRGEGARRLRPPVLPDVTVLIPTLGRPILERALSAIESGSAWPAEIVVVDQSPAGLAKPLAEATSSRGVSVRWMPCAGKGRALGLNTGLASIRTDWILITDDDCVVDPSWMEAMYRRLCSLPQGLVTGRVEGEPGSTQLAVVGDQREVLQQAPSIRFDRLSGGNMGMHRSCLHRVGLFTTLDVMRFAEDGDYAYRALRAGIPILYAPECKVVHLNWRGAVATREQATGYALSQAGFLGFHARRGDLRIWLRCWLHLLRVGRRWVVGLLTGNRLRAMSGKSYLMYFFPGFYAGWKAAGSANDPTEL